MHGAFECVTILQKLPLDIECVAASGSTLLVGTNRGHLLVYGINESKNSNQKFQVDLQRSDKKIAKKPITQLSIVEEYGILISLSDGIISINDSETYKAYEPESTFKSLKTVICFALDVPEKGNGKQMKLCAVSKKGRLMFFYWSKGGFCKLFEEQSCPETPKTVVWSGNNICVGMKREYLMMNAETGKNCF